VAPTAAQADMIGTYVMVTGREKAMELLSRRPEIDACIVYADEAGAMQTFTTAGLEIVQPDKP
jgi:thiamine biosynthesis lipoprotein ApbE